ncbi:putative LRR receptor-like serine/threonine-protein kinase [Porphyridium purpureum]|uniref:Putative LRR receptor-like serine/threonine-protein kinase n=1 Tax=Porphyridium purpureum TaxID=35688 RepID=A0A5J4YIC3_PORPP|nr:putative LRR receptor-like serine/threonine-protein kinase [Porphyridium purpureum]|eukprot:POR1858..scf271_22
MRTACSPASRWVNLNSRDERGSSACGTGRSWDWVGCRSVVVVFVGYGMERRRLKGVAGGLYIPPQSARLRWDRADAGTVLGSGCSGTVYLGELDGEPVACKSLLPAFGRSAQFVRELQVYSTLRNGNVVQCLGITEASAPASSGSGQQQQQREEQHSRSMSDPAADNSLDDSAFVEQPVLVLEYCAGGALEECLSDLRANHGFVACHAAHAVALNVARAILYVHQSGMSHGDLRVGNVLLTERIDSRTGELPVSGRAKLSDFGLVAMDTGGGTADGGDSAGRLFTVQDTSMFHTALRGGAGNRFYHLAPEKFDGRVRDVAAAQRADIFSFGVLLHELVTGSNPYAKEAMPTVYQSLCVRAERPSWEPRFGTDVRWEQRTCSLLINLRHLAEMCWAQDPSKRPTAQQIVDMLREAQATQVNHNHASAAMASQAAYSAAAAPGIAPSDDLAAGSMNVQRRASIVEPSAPSLQDLENALPSVPLAPAPAPAYPGMVSNGAAVRAEEHADDEPASFAEYVNGGGGIQSETLLEEREIERQIEDAMLDNAWEQILIHMQLRPSSLAVQRMGCQALAAVSVGMDTSEDAGRRESTAFVENGGAHTVVAAVLHHVNTSLELVESALWTLRNVASSCDAKALPILVSLDVTAVVCQVLQPIVAKMTRGFDGAVDASELRQCETIIEHGAKILKTISETASCAGMAWDRATALDLLTHFLLASSAESSQVYGPVIETLVALIDGRPDTARHALEKCTAYVLFDQMSELNRASGEWLTRLSNPAAGGVDDEERRMLDAALERSSDILASGLQLFKAMAADAPTKTQVVRSGALRVITDSVQNFESDTHLAESACGALYQFVSNGGAAENADVLQSSGVRKTVEHMKRVHAQSEDGALISALIDEIENELDASAADSFRASLQGEAAMSNSVHSTSNAPTVFQQHRPTSMPVGQSSLPPPRHIQSSGDMSPPELQPLPVRRRSAARATRPNANTSRMPLT